MIDNSIQPYKSEFNYFLNNYRNNMAHSWIFHGPKASGKHQFLISFLKEIYKKQNNFEQYVYEINDEQNLALIEDVRLLINQANLTNSSDSNHKTFVVIKNLEFLNKNSITALLKTIEEPPKNTIIILMTHNLKMIPKTIKSRCAKMRFNPFETNIFGQVNDKVSSENYEICNGQPEILKILNSKDGSEVKNEVIKILSSHTFDYIVYENLYTNISKDFDYYFPVIINIIFLDLKNKFKKSIENLKKKKILKYLDFLKSNFNKNLFIDKKKNLHLIFREYFNLELNK